MNNGQWRYAVAGLGCSVLLGMTTTTQAAPFPTNDPVSMGQGGTGVGLPDRSMGPLFNPATLAAFSDERRWAVLGHVGARAFDEDEFVDELDDFDDEKPVDQVQFAIDDVKNANRSNLESRLINLADSVDNLDGALNSLAGRPVAAEAGGNFAINRASPRLGIGIQANVWGSVSATSAFKDQFLGDFAGEVRECTERLRSDPTAECPQGTGPDEFEFLDVTQNDQDVFVDTDQDIASTASLRGFAVSEVGLTLAHRFDVLGGLNAGITLKSQDVETFDYVARVDDADLDDADADDFRTSESDFNADIGVSTGLGESWHVGATVRNVIPRTYDTALDNEIEIDPQVRAGIGYDADWFRVGADADLTSNDPVGFEDETQFLSIGGELDAFGWAQLRAGYRSNLQGSGRDTASLGLGLSPFRVVRLNLGAAASDNEVGASFQLGLTF